MTAARPLSPARLSSDARDVGVVIFFVGIFYDPTGLRGENGIASAFRSVRGVIALATLIMHRQRLRQRLPLRKQNISCQVGFRFRERRRASRPSGVCARSGSS